LRSVANLKKVLLLMSLKADLFRYLIKIPGWHTNKKIVVIESDDWGSIRMESKNTYDFLLSKGYPVDKHHYNRYDSLESEEDLSGLFEVLSSVKDCNGNTAILTAYNIVANPDFDKIRANNYSEYFYEPFPETYKRYPKHSNSFSIINQGLKEKVFFPQSHGREHLNVNRWMNALSRNDEDTLLAFSHNMFSFHSFRNSWNKHEYMDAFNFSDYREKNTLENIVTEGMRLFLEIWDFSSKSFMAPSYFWYDDLESRIYDLGVQYIQSSYIQLFPNINSSRGFEKKYHYMGQQNKFGQYYMVRNAFFEPSEDRNKDWVNHCLKEISLSFLFRKPAIIQSHRVNFIGFIDPSNRSRNLKLLSILLLEIKKRWPDVHFMTSTQLGDLMSSNS
jgi:hypothetical protein